MNYDAAGNVLWTSPGNAPTTSCTTVAPANAIVRSYDPRNRPLTEAVPGSTNIGWTYYPDGELRTLTSGTNTWSYTYDMRRLPVTETLSIDGRSKTITHAWDVRGHESGLTYGKTIDASNSRGHHIDRHADGGPTTPENHAEVCTVCHDELHSGSEK